MRDEQELGSVAAWDVHGDQVTIWDAKERREMVSAITIVAPCQYALQQHGGVTWGRFVFDGATLHAGLGDAGVRIGDRILACADDGAMVVVDGGKCTYTYQNRTTWMADPVECTLTDSALTYRLPRSEEVELKIHGDVLADDQLWPTMPMKLPSYSEAKSRARALLTD